MAEKKCILIIEDDPAVREALIELLELVGWRVLAASGGEEAISIFRSDPPDVVLTDLMMPGVNGLSVLTAIRSSHPKLPVVVLTAYATPDRRRDALRAGANLFLQKPIEEEDLNDALHSAMNGKVSGNAVSNKEPE